MDDQRFKEQFLEAVRQYSARELSDAAGVTIVAAKGWRSGRNLPGALAFLRLAAAFPRVGDLLTRVVPVF